MPYCINCGTHNHDDARFCSSCGSAIRQAPRETPAAYGPGPTGDQQSEVRQTQSRMVATEAQRDWRLRLVRVLVWTLVAVVAIFAVVFFAAGIAAVMDSDEETKAPQKVPPNGALGPVEGRPHADAGFPAAAIPELGPVPLRVPAYEAVEVEHTQEDHESLSI